MNEKLEIKGQNNRRNILPSQFQTVEPVSRADLRRETPEKY